MNRADLALEGAKLMQELHELLASSDPENSAFAPTVWLCEDADRKIEALILSARLMLQFARLIQEAKDGGRDLNEFRASMARVSRERGLE